MRPVWWQNAARDDLRRLISHIAQSNPDAAEAMRQRIETAIQPVSRHLFLGRAGRIEGTRELVVHPNYIVIYRVHVDGIEITNVIHARRRYP
jgi:toxin ParE1/3/4